MTVEYIPGLAGVPATESSICSIDGARGILSYRGYSVDDLVTHSSFNEVCLLLLKGRLPTSLELDDFDQDQAKFRTLKFRIIELIKQLPDGGHPMDALCATVAAVGMYYPHSMLQEDTDRWGAVMRLIAKVPTIVAAHYRISNADEPLRPREDLDHASNLLYMLSGKIPDPSMARIMDACLILHAEHGMNASTFSARVTGSTLADPYAVIAAAIGTLAGPLHGGANEDVLKMLRTIPNGKSGVSAWVDTQIKEKNKIPGFGHRVYQVKDPRARILQGLAVEMFKQFGSTPLYDIACELEEQLESRLGHKGIYPNVDFYSGIVYEKMSIPAPLMTPIFAIARTAGWLAHWNEQFENNRIFRPSQIYTGLKDQIYVPISER